LATALRKSFSLLNQVADYDSNRDHVAVFWSVRGDPKDARVEALDFFRRLLAFEAENRFASTDQFAVALQPAAKVPLPCSSQGEGS